MTNTLTRILMIFFNLILSKICLSLYCRKLSTDITTSNDSKMIMMNTKTVLTTLKKSNYVCTQYLKIYNSISTSINKHEQEIENLCKKNCQKVWNLLKLFHFCLDVGTSLISKVGTHSAVCHFHFLNQIFFF